MSATPSIATNNRGVTTNSTKKGVHHERIMSIKTPVAKMPPKHLPNGKVSPTFSSKSDEEEDEDGEMVLEDQLTNQKLKQLEKIFEEADEDGGGGLDMDEFRNAMREAMGDHLTDEDLDRMFMKVDTNCDGTVDWDEYLSYMLLEYGGKDAMKYVNQMKPLPQNMRMVKNMGLYQRHHDSIIKVERIPLSTKQNHNICKPIWDKNGRYVSMTKDGVINFWTMNLGHLKRHKLPAPKTINKQIGLWVTAMTVLSNLNLLCIASTSGDLTFYDISAYKMIPTLSITKLHICVTCINYWIDPECAYHSILLFGDVRGNVMALEFDDCPAVCFLQPSNKSFRGVVEFSELLKQGICGVKAYKLSAIHQDLVIDVKFFPNLHGCFLSCCRRNDTALYMGDIEAKKFSYFPVNKGVQCFDYCVKTNIIVTGGKDTLVRVWNPYVPSKPVMILQGQKSPILYVYVYEEKENIISISQEKDIIIFDMTTQTSIQIIRRKRIAMGPRILSAGYFNAQRIAIVLGSNQLALFEHQEEEIRSAQLNSHNKPVNKVAYNSLFDQLVSGGADSLVCVWNANTGERIMQFAAHKVPQKGGVEIEVEITTMRFDPTLRRLITAARDGSVKIWNFNNGALLRVLDRHEQGEITGIVCPIQRILVTGWNRLLTMYVDSYDDDSVRIWEKRHREDVTALDFKPPSTVVSGSYDGDILVWSLETGHVTIRFNAHISTKPCSTAEMVQGSLFDLPAAMAADGEEEDDTMDDAADEFSLKNWMAYNTYRASIAAHIPFMTRRQSMAVRKNAVFQNRGGPRRHMKKRDSRLPTISSFTNMLGIPSASHFQNVNVNNNTLIDSQPDENEDDDFKLPEINHSKLKLPAIKQKGTLQATQDKTSDNAARVHKTEKSGNSLGNKSKKSVLQQKCTGMHNQCKSTSSKDCLKANIQRPKKKKEMSSEICGEENFNVNTNTNNNTLFRNFRRRGEHEDEDDVETVTPRMYFARQRQRRCSQVPASGFKTNANYSDVVRYKYDAYLRKNEAQIEQLILLRHRQSDAATATLITVCAGGWIRFWSIDHNGGLLGQFNAGHTTGGNINAACVDTDEDYLITGDAAGYLKVWDITQYCTSKRCLRTPFMQSNKHDKFPLMANHQNKLREKHSKQSRHRPPPKSTEPDSTWFPPPLLNSFRGHLQAITDITYIPRGDRIATSSVDCSIRVWTIYGEFIGICGQDVPWPWNAASEIEQASATTVVHIPTPSEITLPPEVRKKPTIFERGEGKRRLPADVRRVASATTLRVLHGGIRPYWRLAKNILMVWVPLLAWSRKKKEERGEDDDFFESEVQDISDIPMSLDDLDTKPMESAVLGKSYRQIRKHQPLPSLPKIRQFQNQCDAYGSLPCYELEHIEEMPPPQIVNEIQERQRNLMQSVQPKNRMAKGVRRLRVVRMLSFTRSGGGGDANARARRTSRAHSTVGSLGGSASLQQQPNAAKQNKEPKAKAQQRVSALPTLQQDSCDDFKLAKGIERENG